MSQAKDSEMRFVYTPLPDNGTYIRLLEILEVDNNNVIHCQLSVWPVVSAPSYRAISYTWGDPMATKTIILNGVQVTVRRNCDLVLRQALGYGRSTYIWIDTLCIDQENNLVEKNEQVSMMGEIYGNATLVLACVGEHADDSQFFTRMLLKHRRFLYAASKLEMPQAGIGLLTRDLRQGFFKWSLRHSPSTQIRFWKAADIFFSRSYFSRAWVLQEVFMARQISVCCGLDNYAIELFQGILWTCRHILDIRTHDTNRQSLGDFNYSWLEAKAIAAVHCTRRSRGSGLPTALYSLTIESACMTHTQTKQIDEVMEDIGDFKCEDPRDRIYATLRMVDWQGRSPIRPDYAISNFHLGVQVLDRYPHDDRVSLDRVRNLLEDLRIGVDDTVVVKRILTRSSREQLPQTVDLPTLPPNSSLPVIAYGYRIIADGAWRLDLKPEDQKSQNESRSDGIEPADMILVSTPWGDLRLPGDVRHSDWVVRFHAYYGLNMSVVLRKQARELYAIIGQAIEDYKVRYEDAQSTIFRIYFDPEDLLLLAVQALHGSRKDQRLSTRVCRHPASSYAVMLEKADGTRESLDFD